MMTLLVGGYFPDSLLAPIDRLADRLEAPAIEAPSPERAAKPPRRQKRGMGREPR